MTTSRPCSTRRFAFSMTISATWTWRIAGSSKVEETTSPLHRALHVGDFLRPLVDQKYDQVAFRMVGGDRMGDVLQQNRLTGARRCDDQPALALAERRHQIDDARRNVLATSGSSSSILKRSFG